MTTLQQAIEAALSFTNDAYQLSRQQGSFAAEDLHDAVQSIQAAQLTEGLYQKGIGRDEGLSD